MVPAGTDLAEFLVPAGTDLAIKLFKNVLGFNVEKLSVETALGNNSASYAHFGHEIVSRLVMLKISLVRHLV